MHDYRKGIITTETRRRDMVRQFTEQGYPAAIANECVDLAFQGVDKAVAAIVDATALASDPRIKIQAMVIAMQIAAVEFQQQGELYMETAKELSGMIGASASIIMSRDPGQEHG